MPRLHRNQWEKKFLRNYNNANLQEETQKEFESAVDKLSVPQRKLKEAISGNETEWFSPEGVNPHVYAAGNTILDLLVDPVGMIPGLGVAKRYAQNIPTQIDNFYSPNVVDKAKGLAKAGAKGLMGAVEETYSPTAMATAREFGTGPTRQREMVTALGEGGVEKTNVRTGNQMANTFLRAQSQGGFKDNTLAEAMPTFRAEVKAIDRIENVDAAKQILKSDNPDVPTVVVDRFYDHLKEVHRSKIDKKLGRPQEGILVGRERAVGGTKVGEESVGAGTGPSVVKKLYSPKTMEAWRSVVGDNPSREDWIDLVKMSSVLTPNNLRRFAKDFPDGVKKKGQGIESTLFYNYWTAKKAKNPTEKQKQVLQTIEKIRTRSPNKLQRVLDKVTPRGFRPSGEARVRDLDLGNGNKGIVFQQGFQSQEKDLGGVNVMVIVDTKNQVAYSMMSDGHDLFGVKPPGWENLVNVVPIQKFDIGAAKNQPRGVQADADRASAIREDTSALEKRSGIPRNKGESRKQYEIRVAKEFRAKPGMMDYLSAGTNQALTASGLFNTANREYEK